MNYCNLGRGKGMKRKAYLYILCGLVIFSLGFFGGDFLYANNIPNGNNYNLESDGVIEITDDDTGDVAKYSSRDLYKLADNLDLLIASDVSGKKLLETTLSAYGISINDYKANLTELDSSYTPITYVYNTTTVSTPRNKGKISDYTSIDRAGSEISFPNSIAFNTNANTLAFEEYSKSTQYWNNFSADDVPTYSGIDDGIRRLAQLQYNNGFKDGFDNGATISITNNIVNTYVGDLSIHYHVHTTSGTQLGTIQTATTFDAYKNAKNSLSTATSQANSGGCFNNPYYKYTYETQEPYDYWTGCTCQGPGHIYHAPDYQHGGAPQPGCNCGHCVGWFECSGCGHFEHDGRSCWSSPPVHHVGTTTVSHDAYCHGTPPSNAKTSTLLRWDLGCGKAQGQILDIVIIPTENTTNILANG